MKVHTNNSVYAVTDDSKGTTVTKIEDKYPGGHQNVGVGDSWTGRLAWPIEIGKGLALLYDTRMFRTSPVTKIED